MNVVSIYVTTWQVIISVLTL